ncbi:MAG: hypothetical protein QOJ62_2040 [Actinomycetota bacterium]|nr:hypothetical protein [Actinomycetota bacterium]
MIQYPLGVDGVTTRVLDSGGDGELIVMLHGVGSRSDRFRANVDGLGATGYRAVAVDLPGHGLADKGVRPYSVPYYADFLLGLISALGAERAHVIGTSMGGHIGAYAAVKAPECVPSLVMLGTLGVVPLGLDARSAIAKSIVNRSQDGIAAKLRFVFHRRDLITSSWVEEEFRINNSPGSTEAFEALSTYFAERVDDDVVGEELALVSDRVKMLLVWGTEDTMVIPDVGHAAQKVLGDVPLVLMTDTGHGPYLERADDFNTLVLSFLSGGLPGPLTRTI